MPFHIIVAHDLSNGIGAKGTMPWHCPADMAYFKRTTVGNGPQNAVIMGRKTWESLPDAYRPLPNRTNIVVSSTLSSTDGCTVVTTLDDALAFANNAPEVFVMGGGQLYKTAIQHPECDRLLVTKIYQTFDCDTFFPDYHDAFTCVYASNIWVSDTVNCAFFQYIRQ